MAILTTLPTAIPQATTSVNDISPTVSQVIEKTVDAVVDAASKASINDAAVPDDSLVLIAVWVIDTAGAVAQDALRMTTGALATDSKAQHAADCARRWSIVAALVAVIVTIVVAIVVSVFSFGAGGAAVASVVVAVCAVISATCTSIQSLPPIAQSLQVIVVNALSSIQILSNPAVPSDQRELTRKASAVNLRTAITMIQSEEAQHAPSISVDLNQSLVAADQTSRAAQKLLAYLMQQRFSGHATMLVTEFAQLAQTHSSIVARLKATQLGGR